MKSTNFIGPIDNQDGLPPIPEVGINQEATLRAYAARIVGRLGIATAALLAAEIDEACQDEQELVGKGRGQ